LKTENHCIICTTRFAPQTRTVELEPKF